jgi:prepilin-type N-terminal cleavage/methylation domain-containing protein
LAKSPCANRDFLSGLGVNTLRNKEQKGFTLIELLVVIAIIGLLASVVLLALNSARQKSRDAKRLADVRQIASALELYYNDNNAYPPSLAALSPTWLQSLPTFPTPTDGCTTASYSYTAAASNASTYQLVFCVSAPTGGVSPAGTHTLTQGGIQ